MKDLALYLVSAIVDNKEAVEIEETVDEQSGAITLTVRVAQEDMGKIIGKDGKMIQSIRSIVKLRALKENKLVNVNLAE